MHYDGSPVRAKMILVSYDNHVSLVDDGFYDALMQWQFSEDDQ